MQVENQLALEEYNAITHPKTMSFNIKNFPHAETLSEYYDRMKINSNPNIHQQNNLHTHQETNLNIQQKSNLHIQQKSSLNIQQTTRSYIQQSKNGGRPSKNFVHPISNFGGSDLRIMTKLKNNSSCCSCGRYTVDHPSLYSQFNYYAIDSNCPYRYVK